MRELHVPHFCLLPLQRRTTKWTLNTLSIGIRPDNLQYLPASPETIIGPVPCSCPSLLITRTRLLRRPGYLRSERGSSFHVQHADSESNIPGAQAEGIHILIKSQIEMLPHIPMHQLYEAWRSGSMYLYRSRASSQSPARALQSNTCAGSTAALGEFSYVAGSTAEARRSNY